MHASKSKQIKIYMGKCFRIFKNEHGWKTFISAAIIAVMVALVASDGMFEFDRATSNGGFALICACVWIGLFNSIQTVCKERDIIKREHRSGLQMSAYITSHMLFDIILCAIEALIVAGIIFAMTGDSMPETAVMFPTIVELYITFFLTIVCSDALGLMLSSVVKTPNTAMTVMPFVLIFQFVMAGNIFKLEGDGAKIISGFTVSKWSLNAVCATADVNSLPAKVKLERGTPSEVAAIVTDNAKVFEDAYEAEPETLLLVWGILLAFTLLYCGIAIFSLQFIDKDKR